MNHAESPGTQQIYTERRFRGRFRSDGVLEVPTDAGSSRAEQNLGCLVFLRGFLSETVNLRRALDLDAADGESDAQLLARAYRRWGADLAVHVLGEFSAAILNPTDRTVLLTHDALGLGQIFYCADSSGISFGTHLIDLLEAAPLRDLDKEYIATYLARGYLTTERTPFEGIKRLLPGMSLQWSRAGWRCARSWDLTRVAPLHLKTSGEYEEHFRNLLAASLRATVNPAGKNWVALSGGLDSSSVLSVAGHLGLPNMGAYSFISPDSPQGDEQLWARAVIDRYRVPWHPVDAGTALPFSEPPGSFEFQGEPTSAVFHVKSSRLLDGLFAEHGVKTILTGHGGDALLGAGGGIPATFADHLFAGHPLRALRAVGEWSRKHHERRSITFLLWHGVLRAGLAHLLGYQFEADRRLPIPPWMERRYAEEWEIVRLSRRQAAPHDRYPGRQEIGDSVWSLALSAGGARSHAGYDVRRPLLYRPFFEFMYAVPGELRVQPQWDRYLQRNALRGILPELVRRRRKKVFGTWAFVEGLSRSPEWLDYLCREPQLVNLGVTTPVKWRDAMKQAAVGNTCGDRFFVSGIAMEAWLKQLAEWRPRERCSMLERVGEGSRGGAAAD
jgi:asparagine synthase (glutamine-hydrolysing)